MLLKGKLIIASDFACDLAKTFCVTFGLDPAPLDTFVPFRGFGSCGDFETLRWL